MRQVAHLARETSHFTYYYTTMPLRDSVETLELGIYQLIREAKSRQWSVAKTKMMIVSLFDNNNEAFWRRVYEEKLLDRNAGIVGEGDE